MLRQLENIRPITAFAAMAVLSLALHWNIWNLDIMGIHAWRQTQTMTVVENFATESMNILEPRVNCRGNGDGIVRMEFPLFQWLLAGVYKLFGQKLILARIFCFIISLMSVIGFYNLLREWNLSKRIALLGSWCFMWSPVLFYYALNPLPDDLALCLGIWSLVFLKRYDKTPETLSLIGFSVLLSVATAVKLPFVLFGAGFLPILVRNSRTKKTWFHLVLLLLILLPALSWYAWVIPQWSNDALIGGVTSEQSFDIEKAINTIWGTFHSMLPELLVNYAAVLFLVCGVIVFLQAKRKIERFASELSILTALTLFYLYEVNMIGMAHDYYLFPFLPLIFLAVSKGVKLVLKSSQTWFRYVGVVCLIALPITAYLRCESRWRPMGTEVVIHKHKDELRALTPNQELIVVGNDPSTHIFLYHLGKKGWTFEQDWLTASELESYIQLGAKYLYSNTDMVDGNESLNLMLGEPIFRTDGMTVYPLLPISDF